LRFNYIFKLETGFGGVGMAFKSGKGDRENGFVKMNLFMGFNKRGWISE
jgi:hypothetical protein